MACQIKVDPCLGSDDLAKAIKRKAADCGRTTTGWGPALLEGFQPHQPQLQKGALVNPTALVLLHSSCPRCVGLLL